VVDVLVLLSFALDTNILIQNTSTGGRAYYVGASSSSGSSGGGNSNFYIYDSTASAARLVIGSTGNIGIGTTAPSWPIHTYTTSNPVTVMLNSTVSTYNEYGSIQIWNYSNGKNNILIGSNLYWNTAGLGLQGNATNYGWGLSMGTGIDALNVTRFSGGTGAGAAYPTNTNMLSLSNAGVLSVGGYFNGSLNGNANTASAMSTNTVGPASFTSNQLTFNIPAGGQLFNVAFSGVEAGIVISRIYGILMVPANQQASSIFMFNTSTYTGAPTISGSTILVPYGAGVGSSYRMYYSVIIPFY
jgi:hypothetical protein